MSRIAILVVDTLTKGGIVSPGRLYECPSTDLDELMLALEAVRATAMAA